MEYGSGQYSTRTKGEEMEYYNQVGSQFTTHAESRANLRGIGYDVIDALLRFGRKTRVSGGAFAYAMDHWGRSCARRELGAAEYSRIASRLNVYVVVSREGVVITVAHRLRRHRRK